MRRIDITNEEGTFEGWFNLDAADKIAEYKEGDAYIDGKILFRTASGKLVVNDWNNSGRDIYRLPNGDTEIAEILALGGYDGNDTRLLKILKQCEI